MVMICAGTGFAPMIRVTHHLLHHSTETKTKILFFNKQQKDIIWREELEKLEEKHENFGVENVLSRVHESEEWEGLRGRVSMEILGKYLGDSPFVLVCGPDLFTEKVVGLLKKIKLSGVHAFT